MFNKINVIYQTIHNIIKTTHHSIGIMSGRILGGFIPVIFQVASLLAALAHPGHIVCYAPGDSLPCRRDAS
ncbi:hypothetical protein C5470_22690 [Photorhabdus stackebrandtii]|uniref:Uncharacterized protein n=1 Tax=Photorhabdus stackebrandtii TaxID=1123042 RepID=A0A7X5TNV9_9GAMM|nr:hypothetical protein [Photorhabdus stackebrandtii]